MAISATKDQDKAKPDVRGRLKIQKTALIQEEILIAASKLIAERGFRAVTVDDISAEMGFTKSIVYYHMKNKNEILWKIFEKIDDTYAQTLASIVTPDGDPIHLMTQVIKKHCLNVLHHRDWSTIYNRDENELTDAQQRKVGENKRIYNRKIQDLYKRGVEAGVFRDTAPVIAVSCIIGACNWPYSWFKPAGKFSADEIAEGYAQQLINGVVL